MKCVIRVNIIYKNKHLILLFSIIITYSLHARAFLPSLKGEEDLNDVTLTCMPDMKWHPPTDRVYCLASCNKKSLGDGICDCNQNNKHCNYDNGDCCAASLKRTKIVKFSNNVPCKCRDPDVLEAMSRAGSGDGGTIMNNGDNEDDDYDDHDDVNMGNRDKIEVMSSFM